MTVAAMQMAEKKVWGTAVVARCDAPPVLSLPNMFSILWRWR